MYVVTGGAGFIGSNIVAAIEERGLGPVAVCDRLGAGEKWRNIAKRDLFDVVPPDGLFQFLDSHGPGVRAVIHMGAVSATTQVDADLAVKTNFGVSLGLWRWCAAEKVPLIYASSAATYGAGDGGFDDDGSVAGLARLRPLNVYGWSKHLFDRRVARMIADNEPRPPQWAGLKFFNVYGPNEYHKAGQESVVAQVFARARAGGPARLFKSHNPKYEDGGQLRDFIWVGDCVDVILWLIEHRKVSGLFNCGSGRARSFKDLAAAVFRAQGKEPRIEYTPTPESIREKYQYFTEARMQRLRKTGYTKPFISVEEGVGTYVTRFLAAADAYR
ncbi:MAG: ADP-glyceromanno-heptose 6-epimerase [Rhodospirillales bacterium]|nr:ADP-glyceromanno-heptose 6-epimerase [Rhodospirillales bacterium]